MSSPAHRPSPARRRRRVGPHAALLGALLALPWLAAPRPAAAGGFELPDHGARAVGRGAAFTVRADDLTAIAHNPGGLSRLRGAGLLYSHNALYAPLRFTRAPSAVPQPAGTSDGSPDPLATVENETPLFALGGFFVAATDFGLEDWTFAAGVYGPNAVGGQRWPVTGGQRWMLVELDAIIVYYSLAAAYGRRDRWGVGVTLQLAHQPMTRMSLVVDGAIGGAQSPYASGTDVLATISLAAPPAPTALVGAWWRPVPWLELGASGRVVPVWLHASGDIALSNTPGGSQFTPQQLEVDGSAARLEMVLPPTARAGARYRHLDGAREVFDLELNVVYEAWSMVRGFDVELDGTIKLFAAHEAPDVKLDKRWRDTLSLRLGGTWNPDGLPLSLSAGTFVESGAVPNAYSHLDFPSFDRLGLSAGAHGTLGPLTWALSYSFIAQAPRSVSEAYGKVFQQRPIADCPDGCDGYDPVPANAGRFEGHVQLMSASVAYAF
jgi:long-subunit fatty acid transport protein